MFYDKNRAGQHLRNYTGWSLAWWHNYKWATFRILLVFGPDFFGPLFHRLFPDREFSPKKMSVPSATALLSYVRLAYPLVKQNLEDAIKLGNRIHPNQMALLKNLHDLFQYFIPTVCIFLYSFIMFFLKFVWYTSYSGVFNMPKCYTLHNYLLLNMIYDMYFNLFLLTKNSQLNQMTALLLGS